MDREERDVDRENCDEDRERRDEDREEHDEDREERNEVRAGLLGRGARVDARGRGPAAREEEWWEARGPDSGEESGRDFGGHVLAPACL